VAGDERQPPGQSRMASEPRRAAAGAAQRATGWMGTVGSSPARENGIGGGGEKGEPAAGRVRLSWRRRDTENVRPRRGEGVHGRGGQHHGVPRLLALVGRSSGDGGEQPGGNNGAAAMESEAGGIERRGSAL
jgi:hypothetical protein